MTIDNSEVVLITKDSCSYKLVNYIILHYFKRAVVESYGYYLCSKLENIKKNKKSWEYR